MDYEAASPLDLPPSLLRELVSRHVESAKALAEIGIDVPLDTPLRDIKALLRAALRNAGFAAELMKALSPTAVAAAKPISENEARLQAPNDTRTAPAPDAERRGEGVSLDDFHAYMPTHSYIFAPTREMWPASSVDQRLPKINIGEGKEIAASRFLDRYQPVEQMTWAPGEPMLIRDRLIADGGWIGRGGVTCFNLYRPPTIEPGDAKKADPWLDHAYKVYPTAAHHIIKWLAHRVQCPQEKINHALVLGGEQGVGKDTLLEPAKRAIGPWNFGEASPTQMLGRFNGFLKSVILRVSEARDLGDVDRFQFYDHTKAYLASPPDTLRVDEKFLREHAVLNCVGVVITTNHKTDGILSSARRPAPFRGVDRSC